MSPRTCSRARSLGQVFCVSALMLLPARAAMPQQMIALADPATVEAAKLHRQADELMATSQRGHWKQVARLLEQAAGLRAANDSAAIEEQLTAAQIFHFVRALERAQANLEGAARQALANGRVIQAADAYLMAAVVANERRHGQDAVALARRAEQLARSPHLTQAQCDCILDRIIWLPGKQVAVR